MILDTSFLIDLKDGETSAFKKTRELNNKGISGHITEISIYELYYGVEYTNSEEEKRKVDNLLLIYPVIELTDETLKIGANLAATADRAADEGDPEIDQLDPLIAAVAESRNEPVLTDNVSDFSELDVPIETY